MKKSGNNDIYGSQGHKPAGEQRSARAPKLPAAAWIAAVIGFVMAVTILILLAVSFIGEGSRGKTVLFYCDSKFFPYASMRMSMAASGYDMEVIDIKRAKGNKSTYSVPSKYKGDVIVASCGSKAFDVMKDISSGNDTRVKGYCLIRPSYPGNAALEGFGFDRPGVPVAIFGHDTNARSDSDMDGSAMIFEKLAGTDTLYGVSAKTGIIFPSRVFVTPDQNRMLSMTEAAVSTRALLYSPGFQNELARFIGVRLGSGYNLAGVTMWFALLAICSLGGIAATAFFLFFIAVPTPDKGEKALKGRDSLAAIIFLGISAWLGLTIAVMTFIPKVSGYRQYVAILSPAVLVIGMALSRTGFLLSNKITYKRRSEGSNAVKAVLCAAGLELVLFIAISAVLSDILFVRKSTFALCTSLIVVVAASISSSALALCDKKSRFAGEGPGSYYGNPIYFAETLIPGAVLLVISLIQRDGTTACRSLVCLMTAIIPYICGQTVKRCSDLFEVCGIIYGIIMGILVYAAF